MTTAMQLKRTPEDTENIIITVRYHRGGVAVLLELAPNGGTIWDLAGDPKTLGEIIFARLGVAPE